MDHKEFITHLDEARIEAAIAAAESKTSGEICVYISHRERHEALEFARRRFRELALFRTKRRNAVLIYIVPRTRQVAVLGDVGIHEKCGDGFWAQVVSHLTGRLKEGSFTEAIVQAVMEVGVALEQHFPPVGDDTDELPNKVARD
jgi:uncharacterized membrane protein